MIIMKIYLVILLLSQILQYRNTKKYGYKILQGIIPCGIVAYVGKDPANIDKIKILGLYNTTRGTDSCGIVINDIIKKGIGKDSNFSNFIEDYKLNTSTEHSNYNILVHTRSASNKSTVSDINCAHPFAISTKLDISKSKYKKLSKKGQAPEVKTALVGVHNGFVSNDDDLAKQYGVTEHKVDSGTILSILAERKFEVLKEYEGAAVLIWYYPEEPNTLYIWKGAKRKYATSKEYEEERPMFMYRVEGTDNFYFSSIKESLYAIGGDDKTINSVEKNCVIKVSPGKKFRITPIARDKVEFGSYYPSTTPKTTIVTPTLPIKKENVDKTFRNKMREAFKDFPFTRINTRPIATASGEILLDNEPITMDFKLYGPKVYFHQGRYKRNGHILKGLEGNGSYLTMELDNYGFPKGHKFCSEEDVEKYYFFEGLLCKNKEAADELTALYKTNKSFVFSDENKREVNVMEVRKYIFGFVANKEDKYGHAREGIDPKKFNYNQWATGEYTPMFDYNKTYKFGTGNFKGATYTKLLPATVMSVNNKFNPEPAKVEDDPITDAVVLNLDLNTATEQEHENVMNSLQDSQSSLKNATTQLEKVKSIEKYTRATGFTKSALMMMKKAIDSINVEEDEEELVNDDRGVLYS